MEKMVSIGVFMKVVSIVFCPSFVGLSASCLSYSLGVARYAFRIRPGNMLNNQTKSVQALTTDLGLRHVL